MKFAAVFLVLLLGMAGCGDSTTGTSDPGTSDPGPLGFILDRPNDPSVGTFSRALGNSGLADLREDLKSNDLYTAFIPTNAAFEAYFKEQGVTKEAFLAGDDVARIVRAHLAAGNHPYTEISKGATFENLNGEPLTTTLKGDDLYVNSVQIDGPISGPRIPGTEEVDNGSLYALREVITP